MPDTAQDGEALTSVVVQIPVAIIGFVPIANPVVHLVLFALTLTLTGISLRIARAQVTLLGRRQARADD